MKEKRFNKSFFVRWEMILIYILILINVLLMIIVPETYFTTRSITTIIRSGMDVSFMVLGMVFILIIGEIDVSVSSIMILSAMVTGLSCGAGVPDVLAMILGIIAGALCGAINGLLVTKLKLPSVIVTIATALLFRGIVQIVLKASYLDTFPSFYGTIAWYDIGGFIPLCFVIFIVFAIIFGITLHKSKYGRELYLVGTSREAALYSGIRVDSVKIIAFTIIGIMASISGIIFVGRLNGITYSMGTGYELQAIAIAVLGGVSTLGGSGNIYGPIISCFVMAFLTKALDLFGVHPNVQKIIIGLVLIIAVIVPLFNKDNLQKLKNKYSIFTNKKKENKNNEKSS